MNDENKIDITLLVADAITNNKNLHKIIDKIYINNELFLSEINIQEKAKKFDLGSIEFQKYFLRILQILTAATINSGFNDINMLEDALKKEYHYEYTYIKNLNNKELDLQVFVNYLQMICENVELYHRNDGVSDRFLYKNIDKEKLKLINQKIKMLKEEYPDIAIPLFLVNQLMNYLKIN